MDVAGFLTCTSGGLTFFVEVMRVSEELVKKDYHRTIAVSLGLFKLDNWRQEDESSLVIDILWQIVHLELHRKPGQREFHLNIFWGLIALHFKKELERKG